MDHRKFSRKKCLRFVEFYTPEIGYVSSLVTNYSTNGIEIKSDYRAFICERLKVRFSGGEVRNGLVSWVSDDKFGLCVDVPAAWLDFSQSTNPSGGTEAGQDTEGVRDEERLSGWAASEVSSMRLAWYARLADLANHGHAQE